MIAVESISLQQGDFALREVSFEIPQGEYAVLMGKTGIGKTTILEIICGLRRPSGGRVLLGGQDVTRWKPALRGIGYVPQDRGLFNSQTVAENLGFALTIRRWPSSHIRSRVDELAALLGLGHLLDRYPAGLSGGEAQRVALGRALALRPNLLLFDEPLAALDDATRDELCELLLSIKKQSSVTVLHVTHHAGEAQRLADRRLVFQEGQIVTVTPDAK